MRFINHASVLIDLGNGIHVLTDPWYLSPAFGGWVQNPSPPAAAIRHLLDLPRDRLHVVISHGHDDHLDEFFMQRHLREATVHVPRFKTDGLARRVERLTGRTPNQLDETGTDIPGARLRCFINPDFTLYDAIITIAAEGDAFIHANDNWHTWPDSLLADINESLAHVPVAARHLCIQFGIADSFPLNYSSFDHADMQKQIEIRFANYFDASVQNLKGLDLTHGHYYANQSIYPYPAHWQGANLYQLAQEFIAARETSFTQCRPGRDLKYHSTWIDAEPTLFDFCLGRLEVLLNAAIQPDTLRLLTEPDNVGKDDVAYVATRQVWSRILIGELTLEAIIIGGLGDIHKPRNRNISPIHHKVSKLAYTIQGRILDKGLDFYYGEQR